MPSSAIRLLPLHYVEIGNEDWFRPPGSYENRFAQFDKAIKAKYTNPDHRDDAVYIKLDVQDDHYYKRADEFFSFVNHYDTVDPSGPKIRRGPRARAITTNLGRARHCLMTSMEQKRDLIIYGLYAPLFVNVGPGGAVRSLTSSVTTLAPAVPPNNMRSLRRASRRRAASSLTPPTVSTPLPTTQPTAPPTLSTPPLRCQQPVGQLTGTPSSTATVYTLPATPRDQPITDPKRIGPSNQPTNGRSPSPCHLMPSRSSCSGQNNNGSRCKAVLHALLSPGEQLASGLPVIRERSAE